MNKRAKMMATCIAAGAAAFATSSPAMAQASGGAGGTIERYVATDNGEQDPFENPEAALPNSQNSTDREVTSDDTCSGATGAMEDYLVEAVARQEAQEAETGETTEDAHEGQVMIGTVNTTTLKVRSEADADAKVLGLLPQGEELEISGEENGFYKLGENDGYVSKDYVDTYWVDEEQLYDDKSDDESKTVEAVEKEESDKKDDSSNKNNDSSSQKDNDSSSKKDNDSSSKKDKDSSSKKNKDSSSKKDKDSSSKKKKTSDENSEKTSIESGSQDVDGSSSDVTDEDLEEGYTGSDVVSYAKQFVGNPYKYGGSSLTHGADCSGFVMAVYKHFGVSLPHSSSSLRSVGRSVSKSNMKKGDIVCYSGHVGIYIGNNSIVHASSSSSGIKITSPANYRKIICVRRIF